MHWYRITFFSVEVSVESWKIFFRTVLEDGKQVHFRIIQQNRRVELFIGCKRKINLLNSHLNQLYLADDLTTDELQIVEVKLPRGFGLPKIVTCGFLEYFEKNRLLNNTLTMIAFSVSKYDPFQELPKLTFVYKNNNKTVAYTAIPFVHLSQFLAFNLNNCINSEIARVRPVLAQSKLHFPVFSKGILTLNSEDESFFSVQSYDFWKHTIIVGQSGTGKSFLLKLMLQDWYEKNYGEMYSFVLIDPHASLTEQIKVSVKPSVSIDFKEYSTNLFINVGQPALSTELTMDLFSTVIDVRENQSLARVLKYALNLLFSIDLMSPDNLQSLLTDSLWRKEVLKKVSDVRILQFFETEYQQLATTQYAITVLPIINLISELDFIAKASQQVDLVDALNTQFLTCVPIKQTDLGKNITKLVGGAIIQQIFTIMQVGLVKKKVILIIDELSVVQTPSLIHILSEARKFGLTIIFTQQYLMQVSAEILQSIFANMVNFFAFKLSRDDAEIVARNLNFEIDEFFLKNKNDPREVTELGVKIVTDLNPRETVCRVMVDDRYCSPFKAKTVDTIV